MSIFADSLPYRPGRIAGVALLLRWQVCVCEGERVVQREARGPHAALGRRVH